MTDPTRLVDEHPSAVARLMLSAAINEEPSDSLLASTLVSIAMGSAGVGVAQAAAKLTASSTPPIAVSSVSAPASMSGVGAKGAVILAATVKWVGIASVGGILALSGIRTFKAQSRQPVSLPQLARSEASLAVHAGAPAASALVPAAVELAASAPVDPLSAPAPRRGAALQVPGGNSQPLLLTDEANLIDQAREAVAAGDGRGALRILENHRQRFSQPRLRPEALYLRMQALRLQGQNRAAARVAERLLAEYPKGPQSAAARAVVNAEGH